MKTCKIRRRWLCIILLVVISHFVFAQEDTLGIFDGHADIGLVLQPGSVNYNPQLQQYMMSGAINNNDRKEDQFHFMWKRMTGDFILYARVQFTDEGSDVYRKLGWMIRANLNENSPRINAGVGSDGLTSLQFKRTTGDSTIENHFEITHADVIQLERVDSTYTISVAKFGEPFVTRQVKDLNLGDDDYIGLFTSSNNKDIQGKGIFRDVRLTIPVDESLAIIRTDIGSNLEILNIETGNREMVYTDSNSIRSPIWAKDGKALIYSKQGFMYSFDLFTHTSKRINSAEAKRNNADHVLSRDGNILAFSNTETEKGGAVIYTIPVTGGIPQLIVPTAPSYPHSWSPDGKDLLFSSSRKGQFEVYKVPATGGKEVQLTKQTGVDDSPEYTPDGKYIYFNSNRTGTMLIWRMKADGSNPEPVTTGEFHDWFPHISPDGKWIIFLSYSTDEVSASGHPSYKQVYLRLMPVSGGKPKIVGYLYGGQGSINSPCWSPDSKKIAFASYSDIKQ